MGQSHSGIYEDCNGVPEDLIQQFYGTSGVPVTRRSGQTGAGHPSDESLNENLAGTEMESTSTAIEHEALPNMYPFPVAVPRQLCPFTSEEQVLFASGLEKLHLESRVPLNYGVHPSEWTSPYLPYEDIPVGRSRNAIRITLPNAVWLKRSQLWAQALYIQTYILESRP